MNSGDRASKDQPSASRSVSPCTIEPRSGYALIRLHGSLTFERVQAAMAQIIAFMNASGDGRFLLDACGVERSYAFHERLSIARWVAEHWPHGLMLAILTNVPREEQDYLYEATLRNHGHTVKTFGAEAEAVKWLMWK